MRRTTSALVNAGLVLASLGAGVFLAEGFVRLLAPQQLIMDNARIWRPDPLLGWTHREGVDVTINTGEQPARFVTDAQGFRIPAPRPEPRDTAGRPRLLILGDSFTEGLMVDAESTFAGQLERALAARGLRVTIFNAGVGGWGPVQYALRARQLGDQPFAAVLVCLFVGNDVLTPADTALHPTSFGRRARLRWPRAPADVT
ncbi:MAG TPA: SGNH/GDSL hydrolase family protein, partial [Rhodothermales bacterium]|nr:SGNH/GDSL hydrolase family protein [Rhodothermales bacterium]